MTIKSKEHAIHDFKNMEEMERQRARRQAEGMRYSKVEEVIMLPNIDIPSTQKEVARLQVSVSPHPWFSQAASTAFLSNLGLFKQRKCASQPQ